MGSALGSALGSPFGSATPSSGTQSLWMRSRTQALAQDWTLQNAAGRCRVRVCADRAGSCTAGQCDYAAQVLPNRFHSARQSSRACRPPARGDSRSAVDRTPPARSPGREKMRIPQAAGQKKGRRARAARVQVSRAHGRDTTSSTMTKASPMEQATIAESTIGSSPYRASNWAGEIGFTFTGMASPRESR